jgi:hypothetical protein
MITKRLDIHTETDSLVGPNAIIPPLKCVCASITRNIVKPKHHSVKVNHFLKILFEMKNVNVDVKNKLTNIQNNVILIKSSYFVVKQVSLYTEEHK